MKEEIRRKHLSAAGSMIDDETKNALIQRGRDEARDCFAETIKKARLIRVFISLTWLDPIDRRGPRTGISRTLEARSENQQMWAIEDSPGPKVAYRWGWYQFVSGYTTKAVFNCWN